MGLYGYPEMGRTGLGHSLLAWARCVVWCEMTGAKMLAPRWLRIRIGPYLRGERQARIRQTQQVTDSIDHPML